MTYVQTNYALNKPPIALDSRHVPPVSQRWSPADSGVSLTVPHHSSARRGSASSIHSGISTAFGSHETDHAHIEPPLYPHVYSIRPNSWVTHDDFYGEQRRLPSHTSTARDERVFGTQPPPPPRDSSFRKLAEGLDITRITNRIIAMGMCWRQRTEKKSHRNNIDDLARFLNTRHPGKYMIWNLAGESSFEQCTDNT